MPADHVSSQSSRCPVRRGDTASAVPIDSAGAAETKCFALVDFEIIALAVSQCDDDIRYP